METFGIGTRTALPGQFAGQLRHCFDDSFRCACFRQYHIKCSTTPASRPFVVVVDEVLVIGIGMYRLNVTKSNTVFVIDHFQYRRNGICGTRGGSDDLVVRAHFMIVYAVDDILQIALAWRGQQTPWKHPLT